MAWVATTLLTARSNWLSDHAQKAARQECGPVRSHRDVPCDTDPCS